MKRLLILFIGLAMLYTQAIANDCNGSGNKDMRNICVEINTKVAQPKVKLGFSKKAISHKQILPNKQYRCRAMLFLFAKKTEKKLN